MNQSDDINDEFTSVSSNKVHQLTSVLEKKSIDENKDKEKDDLLSLKEGNNNDIDNDNNVNFLTVDSNLSSNDSDKNSLKSHSANISNNNSKHHNNTILIPNLSKKTKDDISVAKQINNIKVPSIPIKNNMNQSVLIPSIPGLKANSSTPRAPSFKNKIDDKKIK